MIEEGHALFDEAFGAGQTDTALVGQQFADCTDAAASEVIDIIQRTFAFFEAEQVLGSSNEIGLGKDAGVSALDTELLVDLIATHAAEIVAFGIKEQAFNQSAGIGGGGRIARAQTSIDILEGLFLIFGGIFLHTFDDDPFIGGGIDDFDFGDAQLGNLLHDSLGKGLKGASNNETFFLIDGIFDQNFVSQIIEFFGLFDG